MKKFKVGTFVYSKRWNKVGKINDVLKFDEYGVKYKQYKYSVEEDDEYYWLSNDITPITEKEAFIFKLKNSDQYND